MNEAVELDRKGVALAFMKRASRDTFRTCAKYAEDMAVSVENGEAPLDAPAALRLVAAMFRSAAGRSLSDDG
jgi:hypothetical protein